MAEKQPDAGVPIIKIMSIAPREFHRSMGRLHEAAADIEPSSRYEVPHAAGRVTIHFEPLEPQLHGGLLSLPRARVTLAFDGLSVSERGEFLKRFDLTFRRGGG